MEENRENFADDWNDIDLSDVSEAEPTTDQTEEQQEDLTGVENTEAENTEAENTAQAEEENAAEADHSFTLKHLDEVRTVNREEVIALAQKGMDYDRIRGRLDEKVSLENAEAAQALEFVRSMAERSNCSAEDFMDSITAGLRAKADRSDYDSVLAEVKMERREKALSEREQKLAGAQEAAAQKSEADSKRQQDIQNFVAAFPDVKAETIPQDVWKEVAKGKSLTEAYAVYEAARLRTELAAEKQNSKNRSRTTGSRSTAGESSEMDDFDKLWYDGT